MNKPRVHFFQHVAFETPSIIVDWINQNSFNYSTTHLFQDDPFPSLDELDWLIILGGPMNIYEYEKYPWLKKEKDFIKNAINKKKMVLGICLGAQLIADTLGAKTSRNHCSEIGWFPVKKTSSASPFFQNMPETFTPLHWHGDIFEIPATAEHLFTSQACQNQAFSIDKHVLGLQFHLELTAESSTTLTKHSNENWGQEKWIQSREDIINNPEHFKQSRTLLFQLLDNILRTWRETNA